MSPNVRRLPDAELEVMLVIWSADQSVNSQYILRRMEGQRKWKLATLLTVLTRLVDKGFLSCEKNYRNNLYSPIISIEEYRRKESRTMFEKLYSNSFSSLVASLFDTKTIPAEDLESLKTLLDDSGREGNQC